MGEVLGPCKRCGKLMMRPHPTGICAECREKLSSRAIPDIPDPLTYQE
ncbi:MAG: hypothetical protein ACFFDT_16165 [Candidatus Hodarchaeota archaeon]